MFQFPGLALNPYVFRVQYLLLISVSPRTSLKPALRITEIEGGFPHSEIRGSKLIRSSPRLIAAYHVLHRLSAPRHPPNALKALDRSHDRCPRDQLAKTYDQKDHLCLPNIPDLTKPMVSDTRTLQDEQLSNIFPLHNDKQQRHPSFPTRTKLEDFPDLVEPDGIEPTT